ncbi:hypothetical protein HJC23_013123 [Cyclotella cryptica]|uniref:Uncharacterized protein n=1 Tax=Cyclotella cryptica TaxID=29204 RepID=A0ABD3QMJ5_9STRA|eukprot:CCRYP_003931-RA/>CCRYP_003931-RA protein AED:0.40 eAED:0.40 QI:0/-1/0/1/-1/1/1/0/427
MSRQDRQADLRRRMAEARLKLQSSAKSVGSQLHDDNERVDSHTPLPPPAASGILRKSKYTSKNVDDRSATTKVSVSNGGPSGSHALGGLIGGYSSSEEEDEERGVVSKSDVVVSADKKKRASVTISNHDVTTVDTNTKRAKFDSEIHITDTSLLGMAGSSPGRKSERHHGAPALADDGEKIEKSIQKHDAAVMANQLSEETISDEVWNEFNDLIDDDHDSSVTGGGRDNLEKETSVDKNITSEQFTPSDTAAPADAAVKPKKKKRKKKLEEVKENSYDNETITNVEQVSYEARLARLMLLKSRFNKQKTDADNNDNTLVSMDFYDPSLAFQEEDDDVDEAGISEDIKSKEVAPNENSLEKPSASPERITQSMSRAPLPSSSRGSHLSLATILKKQRHQVRHMSACGEDGETSKLESENSLTTDGRWF